MTTKVWEGIVKVQRSIETSLPGDQLLVYSEDRAVMVQMLLDDKLARMFKPNELKFFCHAWIGKASDLHFAGRAEWQEW